MEEAWEPAVVSESDETSIEVSSTGVSLDVKGGGASRLSHSLADLLSPFSQAAGVVGDELGYFRLGRRASVEYALRKAAETRLLDGRENESVSPKLLAPWIEKVSYEDLNEDNILDLWSLVLARAPMKFDAEVAAVIDSLSRLGKAEAELFSKIYSLLIPSLHNFYSPEHRYELDSLGKAYDRDWTGDPVERIGGTHDWLDTITEGGIVYKFKIENIVAPDQLEFDQSSAQANEQSIELLFREGIITRAEYKFHGKNVRITFFLAEVTRLGIRLWEFKSGSKVDLEGEDL